MNGVGNQTKKNTQKNGTYDSNAWVDASATR